MKDFLVLMLFVYLMGDNFVSSSDEENIFIYNSLFPHSSKVGVLLMVVKVICPVLDLC